MHKINISEPAEEDLEGLGDYIAFQLLNPSAAENMISGIRKTINQLASFPCKHELDDDPSLAALGIRKTYYKEYKIYYMVDDDNREITVLRIFHMRVDSSSIMLRILD